MMAAGGREQATSRSPFRRLADYQLCNLTTSSASQVDELIGIWNGEKQFKHGRQ